MSNFFDSCCVKASQNPVPPTDPTPAEVRTDQPEAIEEPAAREADRDIAASWKPTEDHKTISDAKFESARRFHAVVDSPYILPADVGEQERLVLQHKLITFGFGKLFHLPIEDQLVAGNMKVLDCGCGPGAWARQVAKKYPNSTVVGLDMARTVLDDAEWNSLSNLSFALGNVLEGLPFEDNTFDAVYQRLLVLGIPKDKWVDVVKELKRVTKPGGYIELVETHIKFFQLGPNSLKLTKPLHDSLQARGLNLDAAANLDQYMKDAGVEVVHKAVHSAPCGWGGRFGELHEINNRTAWGSVKPFLSKVLSLSEDEFDDLVDKATKDGTEYKTFYNVYSVTGKVTK